MTLDRKAEAAFITLLSASESLKGTGFHHHFSDSIKNEEIVVSATLGEEVAAPSGVHELDISITIRVKHRRRGENAPDRVDHLTNEVQLTLMQPLLHERLTAETENFHCYHAAITGTEREPEDGNIYSATINLTIEAMNVSFSTAESLYSRTQTTTA